MLCGIVAFLAAAHVLSRAPILLWGVRPTFYPLRLFDLGAEGNLPTLFSGALLLADAVLLALIAARSGGEGADRRPWAGLSAGFAFMAADEWLGLHELANRPVAATGLDRGVFHFGWVIPALAVLAGLGLVYARFWWRLPPRSRLLFGAAAALFVGGAVGMEMAGGLIEERFGRDGWAFALEVMVEETMEMAGSALFLAALLRHLRDESPGARVVMTVR